jgi:hypothetical protein
LSSGELGPGGAGTAWDFPEGAQHAPDVFVTVPNFRESVFRGSVVREGVPVADILQVCLDVGAHPARGEAQAEDIRRRALAFRFQGRSVMAGDPDVEHFARLADALHPWLDEVAIVGGWAPPALQHPPVGATT